MVFGSSSKTSRVDKSSDICTFDLCWRFDLPKTALPSSSLTNGSWKLGFSGLNQTFSSSTVERRSNELLSLQEGEKVLSDVRADDVAVVQVGNQCDWADFMVIATGRSPWHVKNIAQALIYKVKQKLRGWYYPACNGKRRENGLLSTLGW